MREGYSEARVIVVDPAKAEVTTSFASSVGITHDLVIEKMFGIIGGPAVPAYLEPLAVALLEPARSSFSGL